MLATVAILVTIVFVFALIALCCSDFSNTTHTR
jgi:hypothetical protein